jgi:hypothetical protein
MGSFAKAVFVFTITFIVVGLFFFQASWSGWSSWDDDASLRALRWTAEQWLAWAGVSAAIALLAGLITWASAEWD